jgi:hypothetical protein
VAWEHYANALELLNVLDSLDETGRGSGALGAIAAARRLGGVDSLAAITQATTHVRVLLKLRRFAAAEAVADSVLAARATPSAAEANLLAPLAALPGRARLAARLLSAAASDSASELFSDPLGGGRPLPAAVVSAAGTFAGYAALGAPADSVRATRARAERMIRSWIAPDDRDVVRAAVFFPSDYQAQPALGIGSMSMLRAPRERLLPAWQAVARDDTASAHRALGRLTATDAVPAPDVSLQYALLALALRDTATAAAILDRVVAALPDLASRLTTEVFPAAALPRVMALRASLTRPVATDPAAAWSSARVLWLHADPELRASADSVGARKPSPPSGGGRGQKSASAPR